MIEVIRQMRDRNMKPLDVNMIEDGIATLIHETRPVEQSSDVTEFAPTDARLPNYVQHADGTDRVTRLTSEAVVKQFEETAKAVDALGADLKMYSVKLEHMLLEIDDELKRVAELAQHIRDEGKCKFEEIGHTANLTADVRKACDTMREQINRPLVKE